MNRDEWVNWQFSVDDDTDENTRIYVLKSRVEYDHKDGERGWTASRVEKISDDAWLVELADEDMFASNFSPRVTEWCKENCMGKWEPSNPVWWEFELETDAMAFKLRWGD